MYYNLKKAYESILTSSEESQHENNNLSLVSLYEAVLSKQASSADPSSVDPSSTASAANAQPVSASIYDQLIAKKLGLSKGQPLPQPVGDYNIGVDVNVHAKDADIYNKLFPLAPPKGASPDLEGEIIGSKGSGNGEVALYWLLNKKYDIVDSRSSGAPDLTVTIQGKKIGIEVKAYGKTGKIGLGRFGKQKENRQLLSIVFGLKALMSTFGQENKNVSRMPSLDTFSSEELLSAFSELTSLDNNKELKKHAHKFTPISTIYQQISFVTSKLGLAEGEYTSELAAAKMMLRLLT